MSDSNVNNGNPRKRKAAGDSPKKEKWTLMFYIAGDAALSASMISQLKELTDAGFQKNTNVLLYFDPNCNGKAARIYDVNHRRKESSSKKTVIGDKENPFVRNIQEDCHIQGLQQLSAALSLRYFLTYSRTYYQAKNYMLFLMGHGVIVGNDQFLPDDDDNSSVTLAELGDILKEFSEQVRAKKDEFHLVAFHSCGMSSVELAFELQDTAKYMMGTQGSAFPGSWPYRQLLKKIFSTMKKFRGLPPEPYPNKLVREILLGLQNLSFYNAQDFWHAGFSADLSICSLDHEALKGMKQAIQGLVGELKTGLAYGARESILLAHWESQSYFGETYTDLYDFCECLQKYCAAGGPQDKIWQACQKVRDELESERSPNPIGQFDKVVVFSDYYGSAYQHSNGLSIFFPWKAPVDKVTRSYANYQFTREFESDSWMSFLEDYFHETKRKMKGATEPIERAVKIADAPLQVLPPERQPDEEILRLGPPPRYKKWAWVKRISSLQQEMEKLTKNMRTLEEKTGTLEAPIKEAGTLAKEIGSLAKEIGSLAKSKKETGTLSKEIGTLAQKLSTIVKQPGTLAATSKETGSLAKEIGSLAKEIGSLANSKETGTLSKEIGTLAQKLSTMVKQPGTLAATSKETGSLAKEIGSLAKEIGSLAASKKETGTLSKEIGTLAEKLSTLAKETGTLGVSSQATGTLAKETGSLANKIGSLAKEIGSLAESSKETGTMAKETGTLAKEMGSLAEKLGTKETGTLAKEIGTLAKETGTLAKETGTLSKETGSLAKETGSLAKEIATLGISGMTIVKNFDVLPNDKPITSRPKGKPNRNRKESDAD